MIHNILVFTEHGSILYSWQSRFSSKAPTNKVMLSGFFNSMNTVLSDVFKGNLQKIILEDRVLCMTGSVINNSDKNPNSNWILTTITVDKQDNNNLIKDITNKVQNYVTSSFKMIVDDHDRELKLNNFFDSSLNKRIYLRTKNKLIVSSILVFLSMVFSEIISTLNINSIFKIKINTDLTFLFGILLGLILVIPSAAIAGNRKNSTIIAFCLSIIASIFSFILLELMPDGQIIGGVGTPIVFFGFSLIEGLACGIIGGTLIDRYFLYGSVD